MMLGTGIPKRAFGSGERKKGEEQLPQKVSFPSAVGPCTEEINSPQLKMCPWRSIYTLEKGQPLSGPSNHVPVLHTATSSPLLCSYWWAQQGREVLYA